MEKEHRFWKDPEFYFSLLLFVLIVSIMALSTQLSTRARLLPLIVAIGIFPLSLANLIACLFPYLKPKLNALKAGNFVSVKHDEPQEKEEKQREITDFLKILLWFSGAYGVFLVAGYLPMVVLFSLSYLKFRIGFPWLNAVILTIVFAIGTWGVFSLVLGIAPFGIQYYY